MREFAAVLAAPLVAGLEDISQRHGASLFTTIVAAFELLVHRCTGQDDIVVGSTLVDHRPNLAAAGPPEATLVALRSRLDADPTFDDFLTHTASAVAAARDHASVPFERVVTEVGAGRSLHHAPVFQIVVEDEFSAGDSMPYGLDLVVTIIRTASEVNIRYAYAAAQFEPSTIARLHEHFEQLLRSIAANRSAPVRTLSMRTESDARQLDAWNATARPYERDRCVHQLLEAQAVRAPEATAVVAGDAHLTYAELDARANRLAHVLIDRGVRPGALVGICLDRTVDMPVAMAAVLKTGAAYVPLDPTHPAERLRYTLTDAAVACTVTLEALAPLLEASSAPTIAIDAIAHDLAAATSAAPSVAVSPSDRAYVIYTSGSTGLPKGVEVEHGNVVAFLAAMRREPGFAPADTLLAVTTLSFDIAGLDFWLPLSTGGRVVIASRLDVLDGARLATLVEQHGVTMLQATPATWRLMIDSGWTGSPALRALCGGEALPRDLAVGLLSRVGELWNMYGPTETTIWSTTSRIEDADGPITIGGPIDNTRIFILDPSGSNAPIGVVGELCIGGDGVARGYHDRPDLTAEKFVTLATSRGEERAYRTGDMARFRFDGRIEFFGRRDSQVKVRGYRIELGEIESVLAAQPGVKQCAVAVHDDGRGDQRIVGYVVPPEGVQFDPAATREALRRRLPEYMVPGALTVLPALPLTPNGKVDRKALRPPAAPTAAREEDDAAMSPTQRRVAKIWRDVLRADRVGLHDNFFDIGGHSLLLVRLHSALNYEFGTTIELLDLFQSTTIAAQARRLSTAPLPNAARG
jgi:amino acid adenylation domain-containing protein